MNKFQSFFEENYSEDLSKLFLNSFCYLKLSMSFNDFAREVFKESIDSVSLESFSYKYISRKKSCIKRIKLNIFATLLKDIFEVGDIPTNPNIKDIKPIYNRFLKHPISAIAIENISQNKSSIPESLYADYILFEKSSISFDKDNNMLSKLYKTNKFEEHCKNLISEIYKWVTTDEPLSTYKFLDTIKNTKLKNYLKKDIELFILNKLYDYLQFNHETESFPQMALVNYEDVLRGVDYSNRRLTSRAEDSLYVHIQQINKYERFRTIIDMSYIKNHSTPKLFNSFDCDIVMCLLELSGKDFFKTKSVKCELNAVINRLTSSNKYHPNGKLYRDVYNSILKLRSFRSIFEDSLNMNSVEYKIFYKADLISKERYDSNKTNKKDLSDEIDLITEENSEIAYKKLILDVKFSDEYIATLLKNPVLTEKNIQSSSNLTNYLIAPLQSERFKLLDSNSLEVTLGYKKFFVPALLLDNKNKKRNLHNIEESLAELEHIKVLIDSFTRINDVFIIKFLPLGSVEKNKIIQSLSSYAERGLALQLPFTVDV